MAYSPHTDHSSLHRRPLVLDPVLVEAPLLSVVDFVPPVEIVNHVKVCACMFVCMHGTCTSIKCMHVWYLY